MRITHIVATPISIPFRRPERWSYGEHRGITTLVIEMHTDSGIVGLGEAVAWMSPGRPAREVHLRRQ